MTRRRAPSLALLLAAGLLAPAARANGRFPAAGQIVADPKVATHLVARTTYGILTSRDGGAAWDWVCEQAVEYTGQFDPPMGITGDGTVMAGVYDHLGVAHGDTCAWVHAGGLDGKNVVDVSIDKSHPGTAVALVSDATAGGTFTSRIYRSPDDAVTFAPLPADLPTDFQALTLDVSPADPNRIYVSGLYAGGTKGAVERSTDGGATWQRFDVPATDAEHAPFIGGLDPTDAGKLYVRLSGVPGHLLVSTDGGATFSEVFTGTGALKGFALSPDGKTVIVGGEADGVWRADAAALSFAQATMVGVQCLAWSSAGVYACASEFTAGFTIGLSTDQATSFAPLMHLPCLRGPLACGASTSVGASCPAAWAATAELIDQPSCPVDPGPADGGPGTGGTGTGGMGTGGAGGAETGGATASGGAGGAGGGGGDTKAAASGCGCRTTGGADGDEGLLAALGGLGALAWSRRRRSAAT